jgi:hypothetical protein
VLGAYARRIQDAARQAVKFVRDETQTLTTGQQQGTIGDCRIVATMHTLHPMWTAWRGESGSEAPRPLNPTIYASLVGHWARPHTLWPTPRTKVSHAAQGYKLKDFEQHPKWGNLFDRYCPEWAETEANINAAEEEQEQPLKGLEQPKL